MKNFKNFKNFTGVYYGAFDGRNAKLEIQYKPIPRIRDTQHRLMIKFWNLDHSGNDCTGYHIIDNPDNHVLSDIVLKRPDNTIWIKFDSLILHTWNTDYITCINTWRNKTYASFFAKDGDFSMISTALQFDNKSNSNDKSKADSGRLGNVAADGDDDDKTDGF